MRLLVFITLLSAALPAAGSAQLLTESLPIDGFAALVNDRVITVSDVMAIAQPVERQLKATYEGEELEKRMLAAYEEARSTLVERALILEDFETQEGRLPEYIVDERVNELIREQFDNSRTEFLEALAEQRITPEEWRQQVREQLIIAILRRQEVLSRIQVPPGKIRDLYETKLGEFHIPEKVKIRMIALNKGDAPADTEIKRKEAQDLLVKLEAGADFAELAREVSEGSKASRGGDWGWIEPKILRPEIAAAIRDLQAGSHTPVVETPEEFYIVLVEGRQDASVQNFEQVRDDLDEELRQAEGARLYDEWIARLKNKHYVKLF